MKVKANGKQKVEMENQIYDIPEHIMRGSGTEVRSPLVDQSVIKSNFYVSFVCVKNLYCTVSSFFCKKK